jgi:META domain-containing protein
MIDERQTMTERSMRVWLGAFAAVLIAAAAWAQAEFPFEQEMSLDEKPMPGSKRVPMLEILPDGRAIIDLWCKSGDGMAEVKGDAVKLTLGTMREEGCTPERLQRDEDLATALGQVTQWRLEDDVVVLVGPTELRYRLSSH